MRISTIRSLSTCVQCTPAATRSLTLLPVYSQYLLLRQIYTEKGFNYSVVFLCSACEIRCYSSIGRSHAFLSTFFRCRICLPDECAEIAHSIIHDPSPRYLYTIFHSVKDSRQHFLLISQHCPVPTNALWYVPWHPLTLALQTI